MEKGTFVEGIAIGAVAGVIAGLLLARKSGKETRDEIMADLVEIKDNIAKRVEALEDLTQEKYEEVVRAAVREYTAAEKITLDQAQELEAKLRDGYEAVRKTIHEHTAPSK
jgi:gas vesicle protein